MIRKLHGWQYLPTDKLGDGGYAQVYRTWDGDHVVKVYDNPHYVNTFEREVQALQLLGEHAGIPALVDFGRDEAGRLCIVTRFAAGERLDRRIRRQGPLDEGQTRHVLESLLGVLAHAHGLGLLHKDIKATNVLVNEQGECHLLDWGVAQPRGAGRAEAIRANQDFVAPEAYFGQQDYASDFYSLGWLAVQALSGALPYCFAEQRDPDYRAVAHCLERPELPQRIAGPLGRLILAWLDKVPARRPVGYRLDELLAAAGESNVDFSECLDYQRLSWEFGFLHLAAQRGIPYAQWRFAVRLVEQGLRNEALFWAERAARQGYVEAQYLLAKKLPKGSELAGNWLQLAAQAGHPGACCRLGLALLAGEDKRDALAWLEKAAQQGHARGLYELGSALSALRGKKRLAAGYLAAAAERGYQPNSATATQG